MTPKPTTETPLHQGPATDPAAARRILATRVYAAAKRGAKAAIAHADDPDIERTVRRIYCSDMALAVDVYTRAEQ